mmetsp:Transcript_34111/g.54607  ORF Transcript_34111/g.54607 Transcript_34111/m.54607 type:complete len:98 (-) Transcript_34111:222-515(-)
MILQALGYIQQQPAAIYTDSKSAREGLQSNKITNHVKHITSLAKKYKPTTSLYHHKPCRCIYQATTTWPVQPTYDQQLRHQCHRSLPLQSRWQDSVI